MRDGMGTASVIRGDARRLPLPDDSVDLVVTSPPYFALRSYQDGGEHYEGQIGDEATPTEFVDALLEVTAECARVLKPSGSIFVNLGDKYVARSAGLAKSEGQIGSRAGARDANSRRPPAYRVAREGHVQGALRDKSLMGLPWRYAIRCMDELGLILRAEIVWSKPNGLPESVTDRVRRAHEQWFHFTIEPRYYSAVDEIREPHVRSWGGSPNGGGYYRDELPSGAKDANLPDAMPNPLGKLPGSVWSIATEPLKVPAQLGVDHFAAFPTEWPKRIIQGWSPAGVCVACGEGRRPVAEQTDEAYAAERARVVARRKDQNTDREAALYAAGRTNAGGFSNISNGVVRPSYAVTGYVCACPEPAAPTTPAVILDPFSGTGTTAMVAKALGRHGITVDMSADYCRLAEWRTNDRDQLAKVLGIAKAVQQPAEQGDLLSLLEATR